MKYVYLFLISIFLLNGCGSDKSEDEQAVKDVIYRNIEAGNDEDVAAYISTMDKDNRNYDQLESMMNTIFNTYDLNYQIKDLKITELKDDVAKVNYVQVIKKIKGPSFRDKRVEGVYILHKTGGQWRIYDTEITKTDYLN